MPTVTQHLEQRVAVLQSDLNAKDQALDDAVTENNERELSRRDWFDEAQRLERENEELKADIKLLKSDLRIANDTAALGAKMLAERDALLLEAVSEMDDFITSGLSKRIRNVLSASAEPKSCGACAGCTDGCRVDRESPPVERDDPAALLDEALSGGDWVFYVRPLIVKARAALENVAKPIERDERADFEQAFVVQEGVFFSKERNEYRSMNGRSIEETDATDLNLRLQGWQARAALERKP